MNASEIKNCDMLLQVGVQRTDVQIDNDLSKAEWVNVNDEMPTEDGTYFVLTDEHLTQGMAWFAFNEDDKKWEFVVFYATSGKEPKVLYWLKDNHWGMIYKYKKEVGEFK